MNGIFKLQIFVVSVKRSSCISTRDSKPRASKNPKIAKFFMQIVFESTVILKITNNDFEG